VNNSTETEEEQKRSITDSAWIEFDNWIIQSDWNLSVDWHLEMDCD
jgi:hypothetical protein